MQSSDTSRSEPTRSQVGALARGADAASVSLPDAEAYRLGADRLMGIGRSAYNGTGERRTRHPDSEDRRNGIFERLVSGDEDISGLIAYSVYKQNKRDWLKAFESARNRAPTLDEEIAYTIGESTPRRLAMYRQIAEATFISQSPARPLAVDSNGDGHAVMAPHSALAAAPLQRPLAETSTRAGGKSVGALALYAVVLGLAGFGLWASAHILFPGATH